MTEPSRATYVYAVRMAIGVRTLARPCAVLAAFALLGCTAGSTSPDAAVHDAGHSACLPALALDCQPAFMPTYAKIYDNLLRTTSRRVARRAPAALGDADRTLWAVGL